MSGLPASSSVRRPALIGVLYLALLLAGIGVFLLIRAIGEGLPVPAESAAPAAATAAPKPHANVLFHVLATLTAVIAAGQLLARVCRWIGQPAVIGEVIAGILLGPSALGAVWPEAMHVLIPDQTADPHGQVLAALQTISQLGIVLYMFVVGLELNTQTLRHAAHAAVAISHASIIVPFVSGAALALWLYPKFGAGTPFTSFALFLGVAMAITAFPVLARILTDRGLEKSSLGVIALSCAATDDVTAWCLLAFVVGVAQANVSGAVYVLAWSLAFIAFMLLIARPLAVRLLKNRTESEAGAIAGPGLFVAILCSALATEAIGIHAVFGAFLLGVIIPCDSPISSALKTRLHDVVTILLLPAFFAITGMNTRIHLISGAENWLICLAIIATATLGKFGGTLLAAQFAGLDLRTSAALGVLMNTRGLMELIVLNIGLSLGVIPPALYAMMVLMALATTMATSPILQRLAPVTLNPDP
jgi:Kef-type K+ transport system membrane component KefB